MRTCIRDELGVIGEVQELQITTLRRDGTMQKLVTIWVVSVGNDLYNLKTHAAVNFLITFSQ